MKNRYHQLLEHGIIKTVHDLSVITPEKFRGRIISATGGEASGNVYDYSGLSLFETSIVDKLVSNILLLSKEEITVGWESSYPRVDWGRSKLDLGIDFIEESEYLFRTAIEVKKWNPRENSVPYNIWDDIFKIMGYSHDDKSDAGLNKYILLFCDYTHNLDELISRTFINYEYLVDMKSNIKYINKFKAWKPGGDLENYDHFFEYFLSCELKWNSSDVDYILPKLDAAKDIAGKPAFIRISPVKGTPYYAKNNLAAVLLKIL